MARLPHTTDKPNRSSAKASPSASSSVIEYSGQRVRNIDIEKRLRESQAFWASSEGRREKEKQDRENRNRPNLGIKFPELVGKPTKPLLVSGADQALIAKFI